MKETINKINTTDNLNCTVRECNANVFYYDVCRDCYWFEYGKYGYRGYCNYHKEEVNPGRSACWKFSN